MFVFVNIAIYKIQEFFIGCVLRVLRLQGYKIEVKKETDTPEMVKKETEDDPIEEAEVEKLPTNILNFKDAMNSREL